MVPVSWLDLRLRVYRDGRRLKDSDGLPIRSTGMCWQPGDVKKAREGEADGRRRRRWGWRHGDGSKASSTLEMEAKTEKQCFLLSFLLYIQLHSREKMKNNEYHKKRKNEYHVSYVNVCKRLHTSTKVEVYEYHELCIRVPECPHEIPPKLFVFFSFCLI